MSGMVQISMYFMAFMLVMTAKDSMVPRSWKARCRYALVARINRRHAAWAAGAVAVVCLVSATLYQSHPWLTVGWFSAIGGQGGLVTGGVGLTNPDPDIPLAIRYLPLLMLPLLYIAIPALARVEERIFRRRTVGKPSSAILTRQLAFGLAHMVVGAPLAVAIGLAGVGLVFQGAFESSYKRHGSAGLATLESTRVHIIYNFMVLAIFVSLTALVMLDR